MQAAPRGFSVVDGLVREAANDPKIDASITDP
jgi:hypothetical protein